MKIFIYIILIILCSSKIASSNFKLDNKNKKNNKHDKIITDTIINYNPNSILSELPDEIDENSGLIYYNKLLWTFNDSGGEPKIYAVDPSSGEIKSSYIVTNSTNVDWEAIAQDPSYIYIGDFGNNFGNRKDLKIYRIAKSDISASFNGKVSADIIEFSYIDQENFTIDNRNTKYDCEAMVYFNEKILIFTKDWKTRKTCIYSIPVEPGNYQAECVDSYNVDGLITGADMSPDRQYLALVGYKDYSPFIWIFTDFKNDKFFNGKKIRFELPSIYLAQTEGIVFITNDTLYFSCEKSFSINSDYLLRDVVFPPQVFIMPLNKWENIINPSILNIKSKLN
ncbi:MAG: hypothetical protein KAT68_05275 [Bacteroidales bacterium]|nr:hypothetical protein [Bacteroidales bacterium]